MTTIENIPGALFAESAIRHLYDPSGRAHPADMETYLYSVRYPFVSDGEAAESLGISPEQLLVDCILADAYDAGTLKQRFFNGRQHFEDFDIQYPVERQHLALSTRNRLDMVSRRATRMASKILSDEVDIDAPFDLQSVQAGWRMCRITFDDTKLRKNDGRPYSVHPLESAAMLYEAIKRLESSGMAIKPSEKTALLVGALVHDCPEDWVKENNHYTLDENTPVMSPLVILRTLSLTGLGAYLPSYVANAARLMIHEKEMPWMHDYDEYRNRLTSNFIAAIVKHFESYHNYQYDRLPEPRREDFESQAKFERKKSKYPKKQEKLRVNIFEDGIVNAPNPKNAFFHDRRAARYGAPLVRIMQGMIEREGDRDKYPHIDWSRAVPLETAQADAMHQWVENLQIDYSLSPLPK